MRSGQQHGRSTSIIGRYCLFMSHETLWNHPHLHSEAEIDERLDDLDHRLAKVNLVNRALWEILRHHSNLREDELLAKVAEIDLRDGRLDDQVNSGPIECPSCGRKTSRRRNRCIYCSADIPENIFG